MTVLKKSYILACLFVCWGSHIKNLNVSCLEASKLDCTALQFHDNFAYLN